MSEPEMGDLRSVQGNTARPIRYAGGHALPQDQYVNCVLLEPEERNGEAGWVVYMYGDPRHLSGSQAGSTIKITRTLAFAGGHDMWIRESALKAPMRFGLIENPSGAASPQQFGYIPLTDAEVHKLPDVKELMEGAAKRAKVATSWAEAQPRAASNTGLKAFMESLKQSTPGETPARDKGKGPEEGGESTMSGPPTIDLSREAPTRETPQARVSPAGLANSISVGRPLARMSAGKGLAEGDAIPMGGMPFEMPAAEWREFRALMGETMKRFTSETPNMGWQIVTGLQDTIDIFKEKNSHEATLALVIAVSAMMGCYTRFPKRKFREDKGVALNLHMCESYRFKFIRTLKQFIKTPVEALEAEAKQAEDASVQLLYVRKVVEMAETLVVECETAEEKQAKQFPNLSDKNQQNKRARYGDPFNADYRPDDDGAATDEEKDPLSALAASKELGSLGNGGGRNATGRGRGRGGRGRGGRT